MSDTKMAVAMIIPYQCTLMGPIPKTVPVQTLPADIQPDSKLREFNKVDPHNHTSTIYIGLITDSAVVLVNRSLKTLLV